MALTRVLKQLGKQSQFVSGLRVTDAETRDVALMVLGGMVNKKLVAAIQAAGMPAVGFCGGDGMSFRARRKQVEGNDVGFVGEICFAEPCWIEALWQQGVLQRKRRRNGCCLCGSMPRQRPHLSHRRTGSEGRFGKCDSLVEHERGAGSCCGIDRQRGHAAEISSMHAGFEAGSRAGTDIACGGSGSATAVLFDEVELRD
jgi:hypothetical protein